MAEISDIKLYRIYRAIRESGKPLTAYDLIDQLSVSRTSTTVAFRELAKMGCIIKAYKIVGGRSTAVVGINENHTCGYCQKDLPLEITPS